MKEYVIITLFRLQRGKIDMKDLVLWTVDLLFVLALTKAMLPQLISVAIIVAILMVGYGVMKFLLTSKRD